MSVLLLSNLVCIDPIWSCNQAEEEPSEEEEVVVVRLRKHFSQMDSLLFFIGRTSIPTLGCQLYLAALFRTYATREAMLAMQTGEEK